MRPKVEPFGEAALLVTVRGSSDVASARWAQAVADAVRAATRSGAAWGAPVPGAESVLVPFGPLLLDQDAARAGLASLVAGVPDDPPTTRDVRQVDIRVRYGGPDGPDLDAVAEAIELSAADVIELHASVDYEVAFIGFMPGFAYLAGLPDALVAARLDVPRPRVAAGSVAIAGRFCGIYPSESPGGWRILGRTDHVLFDPNRRDAGALRPGDHVRFLPDRR